MAEVAQLPGTYPRSIADELREIADRIERGEFGAVYSVTWVADCGGGQVQVDFIGPSPLPGAAAHLSLALAMRKLETIS
jgi:hypothetical protein